MEYLKKQYGFLADPSLPIWKNVLQTLGDMTTDQYFSHPTNLQCHNYLGDHLMPKGAKVLLGLGLNYCIKTERPTNKLTKTITRIREDIRRKYFFAQNQQQEVEGRYIP